MERCDSFADWAYDAGKGGDHVYLLILCKVFTDPKEFVMTSTNSVGASFGGHPREEGKFIYCLGMLWRLREREGVLGYDQCEI